jgi:hypothetical protein
MITCTIGTLFDLNDRPLNTESTVHSTLERLAAIGKEVQLAADKWRISLLLKAVVSALNPALEQRQSLYKKYGQLKDNRWFLENQKLPEFNEEMKGLRSESVELPIQPLRMELFDGTIITTQDLIVLVGGNLVLEPKPDESSPTPSDIKPVK